ncbi:uncharacterized protein LOC135485398 [Lineus longissimus]|uniref:uncharacterized protein LOC135485398 n=1 Tax=Lineus longissimus TaxID=88925 RepID=UPI002B4CBEBD
MAASMKITFCPKSGDKKEFSYPAGVDNNPDLKTMISSLRKLQENANKLLTEIVEKERNGQNLGNRNTVVTMPDMDEEMEDEDESDEDEPIQEPNPKKAKT